ncbi:MAG TPA: outer membrane beta-barrel protein [Burkholderiales bacterium]|jgi:OOP family OmpA-OmpF porin|nr:outer membrane beta-barrel protein [Burkholderiales bacterium]
MHYRPLIAAVVGALATSGLASAQSTTSTSTSTTTTDTWRMPYQSGFWGHAGASVGQSKLQLGCPPTGSCDDKDTSFRVFAGGRFNNAFGLELGLMDFGRFDRAGGETKGYGLDIPLILGFPIGANSSVFLKAGVHYSKTEVSAAAPASIQTGKESGWGPRAGVGATFGLTPQWAVRADWDRYRVEFPGTKDDIDTLTIGGQYTFR